MAGGTSYISAKQMRYIKPQGIVTHWRNTFKFITKYNYNELKWLDEGCDPRVLAK